MTVGEGALVSPPFGPVLLRDRPRNRNFNYDGFVQMSALRKFVVAALPLFLCAAAPTRAQNPDQPTEELVANLAAGRVIIAIYKDALVITTIENKIEPGTLTPPIVPITNQRAGILLGASTWYSPSSRQVVENLAQDLPHVRAHTADANVPHLTTPNDPEKTAKDIEQTGLGFLTALNEAAGNIHTHLNLDPNEPLTELVLADYAPGYGAEVWQLTYTIHQEPERGDYWQTRVVRPRYTQLWPPEKKDPRTLVEIHYPADDNQTPLRDLLLAKDADLEKIRDSSPDQAAGADAILHAETDKQLVSQGLPFLKAAIAAIAKGNRTQMAIILQANNFQWLIPPPPEDRVPEKLRPEGAPTLQRPPEAPTLQKPPS